AISAPGGTALELPDFGTAGDLDITARTGLRFDSAAGRVAGIDRTRIVAERDGLVAAHGKVYAFDSLIKVSTAGHAALAAASAGGDARIEASHVTIVGAGTADTGVEARAGAHAASVALRDSIVHGFDHEIVRSSTGAPATVEARYTRVDGATALDQGAGSIALTHTTTADPRFGAGYTLLPDSPLIDAAEPGQTASAVDLAGNPRIVARVPGGAPLSDMGALETQPGATAAPVDEPAPGPADPADTFEVKVKQRQRGRFVIARVTPSRYAQVRGIAWIGKRDGKWAFGDGQAGETIRLRVPVPRFKGSRTTVRLQLDVSIGRGVVTKNRKVRVIKR
ncbi:MAG TPA: hypothetical protein VD836_02820, partial [Solirubrobacteraceae bacterium]|nr:hypothetical protein [Solirubrobacteraceae bacterium]